MALKKACKKPFDAKRLACLARNKPRQLKICAKTCKNQRNASKS